MRKVRLFINFVLGSMIAAVGFTGCECGQVVQKYGIPIPYNDTTVKCMYGVNSVTVLPEEKPDRQNNLPQQP